MVLYRLVSYQGWPRRLKNNNCFSRVEEKMNGREEETRRGGDEEKTRRRVNVLPDIMMSLERSLISMRPFP